MDPKDAEGKERRDTIFHMFMNGKFDIDPNHLYKPRDSDIILIGPPKSGTTWLQQILHQLRTKGDEEFDDIYKVTAYICNPAGQYHYDNNAEQAYSPRVYKHHESFGIIATTDKQKKIFVVRDPHDAIFSMQKFINRFYGCDMDVAEEEMANMIMQQHKGDLAGNFNCISTWWAHKDDANVLFLFFEDLKKDLKTMIAKIADFVDMPLTDRELDHVTRLCTFEYMEKHSDKFKGETVVTGMSISSGLKEWKPGMGMVRKGGGQIGEGKKLGPKLKSTVDTLWAETMGERFGFKTYHDMYSANSYLK